MNFDSTSISLSNACKFLIFLIPISMIVGNAAININIILLDIFFLILIYLKKIRLSRDIQIFSLVLLSLLVLNTFASSNQIWSLKAWLGFIKHYVLFLCLIFILSEEKFKLNFLKFLFILLLFISVDTYIQYFFGKDIFGYELDLQHGKRLSGPFGDEYVVGGYIAKFFFYLFDLSTFSKV